MKLGFLASNSGSSFRAILAAIEDGSLDAEARVIVSNKAGAPALRFAATHGLPTRVIPTLKSPDTADAAMVGTFNEFGVDLVILSGYLRKLGPRMLDRFHNRVLNIHPSLLPRHGGHRMYGRRVHDAVLAAGDSVSGATVHIVDGEYDHGVNLAHAEVPVSMGEDAEALERRVIAAEPALFIETLQKLVAGTLRLPDVSTDD